MNIFVLDKDPYVAAKYHCDKHVVKMPLETAQMLSAVWHHHHFPEHMPDGLYKASYMKHPCTLWAAQTMGNYDWLVQLGLALCAEYTHRYEKHHASARVIAICSLQNPFDEHTNITPFAQAMPDQYKHHDAVQAYRAYYNGEKAYIGNYKKRQVPRWFINAVQTRNKEGLARVA